MLLRFVHRLTQRIAVAEPRRLRQQLGVVIGIVAVSQPKDEILGIRFDAILNDLSAVPDFAVTSVVRITVSKLGARRTDFHADNRTFEPRLFRRFLCAGYGVLYKR